MTTYKTISLKGEVYKEIENFIKEHPEAGYISVTEFVRDALRNCMMKEIAKARDKQELKKLRK
jgi:metal-responsive CopG/Arc/MetJ family transcriptional regulator